MRNHVQLLTLAMLTLACPLAGISQGQLEPPPPQQLVQVLRIEHTVARELASAIEELLGREGPTIAAEQATNSLLVRGTKEQLDTLKDLVENLDVPGKPAPKKDDKRSVKAFELKYAQARETARVLQQMLATHSIRADVTADERLNRLFVTATGDELESVDAILQLLDAQDTSNSSQVIPMEVDKSSERSIAQIMGGVANEMDVEVDYVPDMKMAIVRGKKEAVDAFSKRYQLLLQNVQTQSQVAGSGSRDYVVTTAMFVVASDDTESRNVPKRYQAVADRASALGFGDVTLVSQMLCRSSVSDKPSEFSVEGNALLDSQPFQLSASGMVSSSADDSEALKLSLSLRVARPSPVVILTSADVQMRLVPGTPSILAAAPLEGAQCLFVIEVTRD